MQRPVLAVAGLLSLALSGCATFTGREVAFAMPEKVSPSMPAPATLWVEAPVLISADPELDGFGSEIEASLREKLIDFANEKSIFSRTLPVAQPGSYRLSTQVKVTSFRAPMLTPFGAILAGTLLPPLLGYLWAYPLSTGDCEGEILWTFSSPEGEPLATEKQPISFWSGFYLDSEVFGRFLKAAANQSLARQSGGVEESLPAAAFPGRPPTASGPRVIVEGLDEPPGMVVRKVAVLPLKPKGTADPKVVEVVDDLLLASLQKALGNQVALIGKGDIDAILGLEKVKYQAGCTDLECAVDIAGGLGADSIIAGTLGTLGAKYVLTLTWVSQKDATVLNRHNEDLGREIESFDAGTTRAAAALVGAATGP